MNLSRRLRIALLALIVFIVAFIFLDFHIAKSVTNTSHNRSRANSAAPENYQPAGSTLFIAAAQKDAMSRALADEVYRQATSSNYFSPILLEDLPTGNQYPVVLVAVKNETFFWTPFYAQSTLETAFAYSNFSAISDLTSNQPVMIPAGGETPAILSDGSAEQVDRSYGIISLPGYRSLVMETAAKTLLANLELEVQLK